MKVRKQNGPTHAGTLQDAPGAPSHRLIDHVMLGESLGFCCNPGQYVWKYVEMRDALIPYNCEPIDCEGRRTLMQRRFPSDGKLRFEMHRVWVVAGSLHRGESNVLVRRRLYIDQDSWLIVMGEGYDLEGRMAACYMLHHGSKKEMNERGFWYWFDNPVFT